MSAEEQREFSDSRYDTNGNDDASETPRHARASRGGNTPLVQGYTPVAGNGSSYSENAAGRNNTRRRSSKRNASNEFDANPGSRSEGAAHYTKQLKNKKRKHRVLRGVIIALVCVLVGAGVAVAWYINNINSKLNSTVDDELRSQLVSVQAEDPFYMLLLGVDKSTDRESEWGDSQSNFRADTIILARIDPKSLKVTLVSIPRDTLVDMGEHGKQKINAAYSYGGAAYMVEVVSDLAGVDISHYAEIDFEQLTAIVDAVGGIEVTLPVAVYDPDYAGIDLPAGTQTLNGEQALGLCRSRHAYDAYGGGDFYRAANQRMVIAAIVRKVLASDITTWPSLISTLADSVTTDMSATDILNLAYEFKDLDTDNDIYSGQLPTVSEQINGTWYELVDEDAWETMMERVDAGETPYSDESQDFTAGIAGSVSSSSSSSDSSSTSDEPVYSGTVLVLNGTDTTGLARKGASVLSKAGYSTSSGNASSQDHTTSIVVYNSSSSTARQEALGVIETLGLSAEPVENDGTYSTETDVVVVLGQDYADAQG